MFISGPIPNLTRCATEQLTSMATEVEQGYDRLRAIARIRNKLRAELALALPDEAKNETDVAHLRKLAAAGNGAAEKALRAREPALLELKRKTNQLRDRIDHLGREESTIHAWQRPSARMVEGVVRHLGCKSIREVLPDFALAAELGEYGASRGTAGDYRAEIIPATISGMRGR